MKLQPLLLKLLLLAALLTMGCDEIKKNEDVQGVLKQLESINPGTTEVSKMTNEQIAKVLKFEYRSVSLPRESTAREIEVTLQALGEERWDCFSIMQTSSSVTISCKRIPYPLLKLLPSLFF